MTLRRNDIDRLARAETARANPRAAREAAEAERRRLVRTKVAMSAAIREALIRAGIDPAAVSRLCSAGEDAAAIPYATKSHDAEDAATSDAFAVKMLDLASRFAAGSPPNVADASFAELLVWSLAQPPE